MSAAGRNRRILFIGLNYAPEPIGIGPYSAGLLEALAERGHEVRAIVGQPYYPDWKMHDLLRGRWNTAHENGVTITRCPHYIPANPTGRRRMAHHMSFASSAYPAARQARRELKPDLVMTVAPSLISAPVAARMARRAGVPLWLHVQDFEVGAARAMGLLGAGRVADAALRFERRALASANVVSTISEPMRHLLAEKGVDPANIFELRNWANHPAPAGDRDYRGEWNLGEKFVALYSGNIANKQGLEIVIEAARLLSHREDIRIIICGEGPNRLRLEELAQGLANVQFHDLQPAEDVGDLLQMADLHLLPQLAEAEDLVLPSKLGNMLSSGRPVLATAHRGSGIASEVEGAGAIVPPGDPQALAWAMERLADDPASRARLGEGARHAAVERWSKGMIIDRFEAAMQDLLG
ncbi:WcaI family glycosyltransferase [Qipengyuania psychrotolerans]|uniref:WcaI family glycosyltransferase n=1 Tax=Qipengyuania psychrotolerans TaxID=2867238 RepID=A0ABX8ZCV8_9SPHN|nr:WcaI family glycosyltransferase [Qipengyuania psychrotolerans]QZD86820.1 WcaI family glycosyltransferase [Qipengyuania psychrotolerans]